MLRQQLAVLKRRHPRPRPSLLDKLFWVVVRRLWPKWKRALLVVTPFDLPERTISRWMKQAPRNPEPAKRWLPFLRNHPEAIAAMDLFTVPTITFGVLYSLFRDCS